MEPINIQTENIYQFFEFVDSNIIKLSQVHKKQYTKYYNLLINNNLSLNLLSRKEKNVIDRHFINSVILAHYTKPEKHKMILDIGTGGGLPGMILKILFPDINFVLADSIKKKTDFLLKTCDELELEKIQIVNERAEKLKEIFPEHFDMITARAVAPLKDLYRISKPLIKPDGDMFFFKGKNYHQEFAELNRLKENFTIDVFPMTSLPFVPKSHNGVIIRIKSCMKSDHEFLRQ